jgi:phage tail-like protein
MPNGRQFDHFANCKFKIEIEGVTQAAFTAVDGVESTTEVVTFCDGSDLIERKRPGRTHFANIVLKRGVTHGNELWQWYKYVIEGRIERRSGSIVVCDDDGTELYRYNFFEAWPCRWKSLVLDAKEARSLIEELEIAVEKVERG